jgi:hypothetical protein
MGKGDGRVRPGQKLDTAFSARAWNRAQDAADLVLGDRGGLQAGAGQTSDYPYTWVLAKNTTSGTVPRWGVLKISNVEITPTSSSGGATAQFEQMPVLTGVTPTANAPEWCVAVEPIAAGRIGRVAVGGVVQAKVNITSSGDQFVAAGTSVSALVSGGSGEGAILWKETGTGNGKWALVRFGAGAGGGLQLAETTAVWPKGTQRSVLLTPLGSGGFGSDQRFQFAFNEFTNLASGVKVLIAKAVDGRWYLVAAEC